MENTETATVEENQTKDAEQAGTVESVAKPEESPAVEQKPQDDAKPPLRELPLEEQLSVWQKTARKHEDQAKANKRDLDKANADLSERETELLEARIENAKLHLKLDHPELPDALIATCDRTDPDSVKAWGEQMSEIWGASHGSGRKAAINETMQSFNRTLHSESNTPSGKTGSPSFNDLMQQRLKEARAQYSKEK
ncbi:hypothetical protein [Bifidobacterium olomucense]|uniref:Scaffolding protein n=1 Tax=Bifidobacterium olomucense TaxID=2675324 RepID=A0A7Y0HXL4_9BIFI|nr:hypothetical protein [Bifidobacterium sp. DSM 109959]NMM98149.1 hypothetical protein [Bifidobacterium sp. DSM 109959]